MRTIFPLYPMSNLDRWNNIMEIIKKQSSKTQNTSTAVQEVIRERTYTPKPVQGIISRYFSNISLNKIISRRVK